MDPSHTSSYLALGKILMQQGDRAEALRYLRQGSTAAARTEQVAAALKQAEAHDGEPPAKP